MKQLTLFQSFQKRSKYPVVIAEIIHSFLPNTETLFLEQRLRFLVESKELITDGSWHGNEGTHSFPDIDTLCCESYNIVPDQVSENSVNLVKHSQDQCMDFKRLCVRIGGEHSKDVRFGCAFQNVELENETDFSKLVLLIEETLTESNKYIIKKIEERHKSLVLKGQTVFSEDLIPVLVKGHTLFPGPVPFTRLRTMRHDKKVVFNPTPTVRTLHLLL